MRMGIVFPNESKNMLQAMAVDNQFLKPGSSHTIMMTGILQGVSARSDSQHLLTWQRHLGIN
jgi:hypothetical protein